MRSVDLTATARIRNPALGQFGRYGFGVGLWTITEAAGVSAALGAHPFGSKDDLRKARDDYAPEEIHSTKTDALRFDNPATWFTWLAEITSHAPLITCGMRSMQASRDLAKMLWHKMIDSAKENYLDEGGKSGAIKPSPDPSARARYLAKGGGLLLYLHRRETPTHLRVALRDYARYMVLPDHEVHSKGLLPIASCTTRSWPQIKGEFHAS